MSTTLLVIDDDPATLRVVSSMLETFRISAITCQNAELGLSLLRDSDYDGVIVDLILPQMNGLEFLQRAKPKRAILMSGQVSAEVGRSLASGYCYLVKPFTLTAMSRALLEAGILNKL